MGRLSPHYQRIAIEIKNEVLARREDPYRNQWGETYCQHGYNLGTWDGPDFMCGYCENGDTPYEYAVMVAQGEREHDRKVVAQQMLDALTPLLKRRDDDRPNVSDVLSAEEMTAIWRPIVDLAIGRR